MNQPSPFLQEGIALFCTLFAMLLMLSGCAHPSSGCHWLYDYIPESRTAIAPHEGERWLAWMVLGNDDDGIFGEKTARYDGEPLTCRRAAAWQLRNPLHNFCYYVVGNADSPQDELDLIKVSKWGICLGHYHPAARTVFADEGSSFYFGLHGCKPFMSLRLCYLNSLRSDFYCGWRERGNFGLKCVLLTSSPFASASR